MLDEISIKYDFDRTVDDFHFVIRDRLETIKLKFELCGKSYSLIQVNRSDLNGGMIMTGSQEKEYKIDDDSVDILTIYYDILDFKKNNRSYIISQLFSDSL